MAFNTTQPQQNSAQNQACGFLNFYLPTQNGGRRKLGSLPLRESRPAEKQVYERLMQDPEAISRLVSLLEVEFNPYQPDSEDQKFAF